MTKNSSHHTNGISRSETQLDATPCRPNGTLVVIGGKEKKEGDRPILELLAKRVGSGKLIVATLASEEPQEQWQEYQKTFRELGVERIEQFDVRRREELIQDPKLELLDDATVLFFAGGDQMKITSRFGGTPLCDRLRQIYEGGATVAGTSSGASVMTEVMMAAGETDESNKVGGSLRLAPGLGLLSGIIIDQHFAERGRMGRLLGAVAQNPRLLGIGIDEDTALIFKGHTEAAVLGSGAVYIVDGRPISNTNTAEGEQQTMSMFGAMLHVLTQGDRFDLASRQPRNGPPETEEQEFVALQ
jgi:cyanophycinase